MSETLEERRLDKLLRTIAEGTASVTGGDFLHSLVRYLAEALDVRYSFVSEFAGSKTRVRTLAFWAVDHFLDNFEYDLAGTPCEAVLAGEMCLYKEHVRDFFPDHRKELEEIGAESYLAIPLMNADGAVLGHLALIDTKPMMGSEADLSVFRIFAVRAQAEMERMRAEESVRRSEERLASVLASAMDAIITIDETRHITLFNDAAERIFGCARSWAIGQPVDRFLSKPFRKLLDSYLQDADRKGGKPANSGLRRE